MGRDWDRRRFRLDWIDGAKPEISDMDDAGRSDPSTVIAGSDFSNKDDNKDQPDSARSFESQTTSLRFFDFDSDSKQQEHWHGKTNKSNLVGVGTHRYEIIVPEYGTPHRPRSSRDQSETPIH